MRKFLVGWLWPMLKGLVFAIFFWAVLFPMITGYIGYAANYGGIVEQQWLDQAIEHLRWLRQDCQDEELAGVLDYTMERYNQIGPFDVAVSRCDWYPRKIGGTLGVNNPLVPGLTLDISVLDDYDIHIGAGILVHEALHDYFPYGGHSHVYPMMERLEKQYVYRTRNSGGPRLDRREAHR